MILHAFSKHISSNKQIYSDSLSISLKNQKKQIYYERKKLQFEKLLDNIQQSSNKSWLLRITDKHIVFLENGETVSEYDQTRDEKQKLLKRLIILSENLAINPQSEVHVEEFRNLDNQLKSHLNLFDWVFEYDDAEISILKNHEESAKKLKKLLGQITTKTKLTYIRDLRQSFRNLVKYLFKQHEGEESNKNEFIPVISNSFLLIINYKVNGTKNNPRTIRTIM